MRFIEERRYVWVNLHPFVVMKGDRWSGGGSQTLLLEIHLQSVKTSHIAVSHLRSSFNFNFTFEYLPHLENAVQWSFSCVVWIKKIPRRKKRCIIIFLITQTLILWINGFFNPLKLKVRLSKAQIKFSFNIAIYSKGIFFSRQ